MSKIPLAGPKPALFPPFSGFFRSRSAAMLPQKVKNWRKNCSILTPAGKFRHALRKCGDAILLNPFHRVRVLSKLIHIGIEKYLFDYCYYCYNFQVLTNFQFLPTALAVKYTCCFCNYLGGRGRREKK
jgi:hypothetical protein